MTQRVRGDESIYNRAVDDMLNRVKTLINEETYNNGAVGNFSTPLRYRYRFVYGHGRLECDAGYLYKRCCTQRTQDLVLKEEREVEGTRTVLLGANFTLDESLYFPNCLVELSFLRQHWYAVVDVRPRNLQAELLLHKNQTDCYGRFFDMTLQAAKEDDLQIYGGSFLKFVRSRVKTQVLQFINDNVEQYVRQYYLKLFNDNLKVSDICDQI